MARLFIFKEKFARRDRRGQKHWRRIRCVEQGEVQLVGDTLYRRGAGVHLEPQMADLVAAVMLGGCVRVEEVIEYLWPNPDKQPDAYMDVYYMRLWTVRRKLALLGLSIVSIRGRGLQLEEVCQ